MPSDVRKGFAFPGRTSLMQGYAPNWGIAPRECFRVFPKVRDSQRSSAHQAAEPLLLGR